MSHHHSLFLVKSIWRWGSNKLYPPRLAKTNYQKSNGIVGTQKLVLQVDVM